MKLLKSERFTLPTIFFVTTREEIKELPLGLPFIYGTPDMEKNIVRLLEYDILYQRALKSGFPFDFKKLLREAGFTDMQSFYYSNPIYVDYKTEDEDYDEIDFFDVTDKKSASEKYDTFLKDSVAIVHLDVLKKLNILPVWLDTIEETVRTNLHNFVSFNAATYNKKLDGMYGGIEVMSPPRNLIINDISGSIPKSVSSTILAFTKTLAETFYADVLITGSKSTLYEYENLHNFNVDAVYSENGMDNDQAYFKKLVTDSTRKYNAAIVFGDNHHPGQIWSNEYNKRTRPISDEDGKKLCKWEIAKVLSFHTDTTTKKKYLAGYARWFSPMKTEYISDWITYLNK